MRDLRDQVVARNSNIDVPSLEWIRAQFWPRNPFRRSSSSNTGRLAIQFMIQSRQLHADHVDSHYCAAIFKYLKHFAIMFCDHSTVVCLDYKHNIKIGEPDCPVAAVDRGKEVLVHSHRQLHKLHRSSERPQRTLSISPHFDRHLLLPPHQQSGMALHPRACPTLRGSLGGRCQISEIPPEESGCIPTPHFRAAQVEACLNSRPLGTLSSHSPDGITVLTPGHFLVGRALQVYTPRL